MSTYKLVLDIQRQFILTFGDDCRLPVRSLQGWSALRGPQHACDLSHEAKRSRPEPDDQAHAQRVSAFCSAAGAACSERRFNTARNSKIRCWPSMLDSLSSQPCQYLGRSLGGVPVRRADLADRPRHPTVLAPEDHVPLDVEVGHVDAFPGGQLLQHGREILSGHGSSSWNVDCCADRWPVWPALPAWERRPVLIAPAVLAVPSLRAAAASATSACLQAWPLYRPPPRPSSALPSASPLPRRRLPSPPR